MITEENCFITVRYISFPLPTCFSRLFVCYRGEAMVPTIYLFLGTLCRLELSETLKLCTSSRQLCP